MGSELGLAANIQTERLDHYGLVASVCKDLGLAEKLNKRFPNEAKARRLSPGEAVVAMIINGLGFTNRRLYLTHQFYEDKPLNELLDCDESIEAKEITDYTLANTLDSIYGYGATSLLGEIAYEIGLEEDLLGRYNHLDTTSLTVQGDYEVNDPEEVMEVTYGHSKDHRPDLKQVVLSLVVNGPAHLPLWMEPLDGNSSDKTSFHETVEQVELFKKGIDLSNTSKWIADSALYSKEKLLGKLQDYKWLTRVPETVKEAREWLKSDEKSLNWETAGAGYQFTMKESDYGDIKQRWMMVYSEQAYQREKKTLERRLSKQAEGLDKALWHLSNQIFITQGEIKQAISELSKRYKLFQIDYQINEKKQHQGRGRPKNGEEKVFVGYQVTGKQKRKGDKINELLNKKGRFILATNDMDKENYPDKNMLPDYKSQQGVERGFRFLKDPWFMVSSIFLKLPRRIEALMLIMTLCLLVYNIAEYRLRETLKKQDDTLPNQLGKEVKNPTMRWIFQLMEGISIVKFYDANGECYRCVVTNINATRKKIINFFGETAHRLYGLIKNLDVG